MVEQVEAIMSWTMWLRSERVFGSTGFRLVSGIVGEGLTERVFCSDGCCQEMG